MTSSQPAVAAASDWLSPELVSAATARPARTPSLRALLGLVATQGEPPERPKCQGIADDARV